eukprot:scaffold25273_cov55-Phaeocystis_antarctica.AAC.1
MSARATSTRLESASCRRLANRFVVEFSFVCGCGIYIELADLHSTRSEKLRTVSKASKRVYGGLHFKSRALTNYLRRRSPGPPFPPDHRQAGGRGAINLNSARWLAPAIPTPHTARACHEHARRIACASPCIEY